MITPYLVLAAITLTRMMLIAATRFPASLAAEDDPDLADVPIACYYCADAQLTRFHASAIAAGEA